MSWHLQTFIESYSMSGTRDIRMDRAFKENSVSWERLTNSVTPVKSPL